MPGKVITSQQEKLYMSSRKSGHNQVVSAAKAGISERSGRSIESGTRGARRKHDWRTRRDPFAKVWDNELVPLLESEPMLHPMTLLEYLQNTYPGEYPDSKLRTLERRVKQWKALNGPKREIIFRQEHELGRQGISDFTELKGIVVTIKKVPLKHLLFHFRLSRSGWSHIKVTLGGESFSALAEGVQEALWRLGGAPQEHRTDSLSAAFKNLSDSEQEDITERYHAFCQHFGMVATRNNKGVSHENGSIESPHGHIKRRIEQAFLLRGCYDFTSIEAYQSWLDSVVHQHNRRNATEVTVERDYLQPLPSTKAVDFAEVCARVSSSSTIDVRRATYSVPSRLIGENLRIHLYHDRLECYLGATHVINLSRVYPIGKTNRARNIDYRHMTHSLIKKPQAFRFSRLRDDLLPSDKYKRIWQHVEKTVKGKAACKLMVGLLHLAATHDCEQALADDVIATISQSQSLSLIALQARYGAKPASPPAITVVQHTLSIYDELVGDVQEVYHG